MRRCDLEHIIRAAGAVTGEEKLVIIGSQSVLGQFPDAPETLLRSAEADVFAEGNPTASDLIDGAIGEGSPFHELFGYYAQGVGAETAVLPDGWSGRLVPIRTVNTGDVTGWCLDVHDLAISKYVAGRQKDLEFTKLLAAFGLTKRSRLESLLEKTLLPSTLRVLVLHRVAGDFRETGV